MSNEHITDERAAFEAWFRDHHGSRACFSQYDTGTFKGDYRDALVAGAWNVWQASRAALRPAAQPAPIASVAMVCAHCGVDRFKSPCPSSPCKMVGEAQSIGQQPAPAAQPVGEPVAWECFRDITYFDMWAVRPIGCNTFKDTFHVISQNEAQVLCDVLMGKIAQPQPLAVTDRVPMTEEQISDVCDESSALGIVAFLHGVRAAEIHHRITTPKADK